MAITKTIGFQTYPTIFYGIPDISAIYQQIETGEPIILDQAYIKDLNIKDYKSARRIDELTTIDIVEFSAKNAFFDCDNAISLGYLNFKSDRISFENSIFRNGEVDFGHASFNGNTSFENILWLSDQVNFRFANFSKGNVSFAHCLFLCDKTIFVNTHFGEGNANFRDCTFEGEAHFHYARFNDGDVSFDKSMFRNQKVDFRKVEFGNGKAEFRRVQFGNGEINFSESEFGKGKVSFRSSQFGAGSVIFDQVDFGEDEVSFEGVTFGSGKTSFQKAQFSQLNFSHSEFHGLLDLRVKQGEQIDLSHSIVKDIIDIAPDREKIEINRLMIRGMRILGRIFIDWRKNSVRQMIQDQPHTTYNEKAEQFNILKQNFNQNGQYDDEDKAYVWFKRNELEAQLEYRKEKGGLNVLFGYFSYYFQKLLFDKMGLYATNLYRVLLSMVIVYACFSLVYIVLSIIQIGTVNSSLEDPEQLMLIPKSFYYSAITFLTIGYEDYYPLGAAKWAASVEGYVGVFMMSYFTAAFVRKILR